MKMKLLVAALACAVLAGGSAMAQAFERTERVRFSRGTSSSTIKGVIRGYQTMDYILGARQGQTLTVALRASNRSAYFNVLPVRGDEAIFNGSIRGPRYIGRLPQTGDYRIRVYLMRSAARRGEQALFSLDVGVSGIASPGSRTGAGAGPIGSGPIISAGNMPAFCRGEASSMYGTRPAYIQVGRIASAPGGGSWIDGSADKGREGIKRFRCRFDARNRFIDVMALTRDGL